MKIMISVIGFVCIVLAIPCQARLITVDDDGPADFNNIQDAIDDSNDGDVIMVYQGIYIGELSLGNKNLTLKSEDPNDESIVKNTIITSGGINTISNINDGALLEGFTFSNCTSARVIYGAHKEATVRKCRFIENAKDVFFRLDGVIEDCYFKGNSYDGGYVIKECNRVLIRRVTAIDNDEYCIYDCTGTIEHCLFVGNKTYAVIMDFDGYLDGGLIQHCVISGNLGWAFGYVANTVITHCIITRNTAGFYWEYMEAIPMYCCISDYEGAGVGNISDDPLFVDAGYWYYDPNLDDIAFAFGDYHLKSAAGRWDSEAQAWICDDVNSPCIDAGDPYSPVGDEPTPNGERINMGLYGGTSEASKSGSAERNPADLNRNGIVDFLDFSLFANEWLWERQ